MKGSSQLPKLREREVLLLRDSTKHLRAGERGVLRVAVAGHRRLTAAEADTLRDAIFTELAQTGVDVSSGEINDRGRELDDLIDRIGRMSELSDSA